MVKKFLDTMGIILNIPYSSAKSVFIGFLLMLLSGALYFIGAPEFLYATVLIVGAILFKSIGIFIGSNIRGKDE